MSNANKTTMVRLVTLGLALATVLSTVAGEPLGDTCADDLTWRFNSDEDKDCAWVGRNANNRCDRTVQGEPLSHYCPMTCDTCPELEEEEDDDDEDTTEGCCSLNYRDCIGWCGTTEDTCGNCNHEAGVVWLDNGAPPLGTCTKRWSPCEADSCCPGLECRAGAKNNLLACRPELPREDEEESEDQIGDEGGCCSLDYKECIDWCGPKKDSCLGCNHHDGVGWLKDGSAIESQCKRRWSGCGGSPNSCCAGLECRPNENNWMACQPALSTEAPTFAPTEATSLEPTSAEEREDTNEVDGCCSLDYKECIDWCGPTRDLCLGCNHHDGVGWLTNGSAVDSQCKRRWSGCGGSPNSCCDGLICRRDPNNWLACLPEL